MRGFALDDRTVFVALIVCGALYATLFASNYELRVLTLSGVYVILVLGYQFVFGHAGALSLAQGAFFGLGGYVTGILGSRYGWPFPITFPLSLLLPALLAATVALPVLRLQSHYFALATLAIAQTILLLAVNWIEVTGGANGLYGVPGITAFGLHVPRGLPLFAFVWSVVAIAAGLSAWFLAGRRRHDYTMLRDAPLAAAASGLDVGRARALAFVMSALFGGSAGALYVHTLRVVSPEILGFGVMVLCLTMTVIGGRTRILGAVVGAVVLTHLPEWFRGLEQYYLIATGAILLAAILFAPGGLAALLPARRPAAPTTPDATARGRASALTPPANLEVTALSKLYGGVCALDGVDLTITGGEIVGVVGPNGSGKTTLINLVTGFARPDSGSIRWNGVAIAGLAPHRIARAGIARSFQTPELPPAMTVADAVATGRPRSKPNADPTALLTELDLVDLAATPCGSLAHGVRRRTDIARALAGNPGLLILDEPAAGLTDEEAARLATILRRHAAAGLAILIVEHNTAFLAGLADRLVCLSSGMIISEGMPAAVLRDPLVVAAWLGAPADTVS